MSDWLFLPQNPTTLRSIILCASAVVIVLPLAMLRDIANLSSISVASLSFYACFLLYVSRYVVSVKYVKLRISIICLGSQRTFRFFLS